MFRVEDGQMKKVEGKGYTLYQGDCLEVMPTLEAGSVNAIIADPPYGTTSCAWDSVIPFAPMWDCFKQIIKPNGAIVLFGGQPFTSALIMSNPKWFKYCWTWDKRTGKGHLVAKYRPLQQTEDIAVFGKDRINYYPILKKRPRIEKMKEYSRTEIMGRKRTASAYEGFTDFWHPKTVLSFAWSPTTSFHPTEKPVALLIYLVHTYTKPNDTVLDFTMGSGSTGVAALQAGRRFVGIELDENYFNIAHHRIEDAARAVAGLPKHLTGQPKDYTDTPLFAMEATC